MQKLPHQVKLEHPPNWQPYAENVRFWWSFGSCYKADWLHSLWCFSLWGFRHFNAGAPKWRKKKVSPWHSQKDTATAPLGLVPPKTVVITLKKYKQALEFFLPLLFQEVKWSVKNGSRYERLLYLCCNTSSAWFFFFLLLFCFPFTRLDCKMYLSNNLPEM